MTNQADQPPGPEEMIETWRKAAADAEQRWNDYFNQLMGTEAYGQMMARSMENFISMQSTLTSGMEQYLRALNIPSRTDVVQLAERVALIEQKIDAIATALGTVEEAESNGARAMRRTDKKGRKKKSKDAKRDDG